MVSGSYLLAVIFISIQGSCGQIALTQTPDYISVSPGDTVTISCGASSGILSNVNWYQQKPGEPPKLLIYDSRNRYTGVPDRFSGSVSGTDFTLTTNVTDDDDAGDYYCQQGRLLPYSFGSGTKIEMKRRDKAAPSALIFGPSNEEMKTGKVTLVCLVNDFYPADVWVTWKEDNKDITDGVQHSAKTKNKDGTYSMSSMLSLTREQFMDEEKYTCEVKHSALTSVLVKSLSTAECSI